MDRVEIRIALEERPLLIPYSGSESGHHYESVLKDPTAVERFPELQGEPMMKHLVLSMHAPNAMFETARIVHWFAAHSEPVERCFEFGFFFRDRQLFQAFENCMMFAGNLLSAAGNNIVVSDESFFLEIQPAVLLEESLQGWIMDLYVAGRGVDQDAAKNRLDQNLERLIPLLQSGGVPPPKNGP